MPTIVRAEYATPTVYSQKDADGINNIAYLTGNNLIASRAIDGFLSSTDGGATWGSSFGVGQGGPFIGIYRMHTTVGAITAGRLLATKDTVGDNGIWVSDDNGVTWTKKAATYSDGGIWNPTIFQRSDAIGAGAIYAFNSTSKTGRIIYSTDGGETWPGSISSLSGVSRHPHAQFLGPFGRFFDVRFNSSSGLVRVVRHDQANPYNSTTLNYIAGISDYNTSKDEWVANYHTYDALVGVAYITTTNEWAFRLIDIFDPYRISTPQFTSSTGGIIDKMYFMTPTNNITQKWSVITQDTASLWQLWVSDDNDWTSWSVVYTRDGLVTEGNMTNQVVTSI